MNPFRAAAIQFRSGTLPDENLENLEPLLRRAAEEGAQYVQTPEMTNVLVQDRESLLSLVQPEGGDPFVGAGVRLARDLGIWLHFGSLAIRNDNGDIVNRSILLSPQGETAARYDKIHMFDVDLPGGESWRESNTYRPGEKSVTATLPFAEIGLAICYDIRFPQLFRSQAQAGATVLTAPAAFTRQTGEAHWHVLQRARAIENGAFLVSAAQGGKHQDGRVTYGHSLVVDPWGRILAEAGDDRPGVIYADINPQDAVDARRKIPSLKNERRFSGAVKAEGEPLERMQ